MSLEQLEIFKRGNRLRQHLRFREEDYTKSQYQDPQERNSHRNSPGTSIVSVFGAKIDAICNEDTECDKQLICAGNS